MRTTLTLDDDVAALLERYRKRERQTLKQAVNANLRAALQNHLKPAKPTPFRTKTFPGGLLLPNIDNVAEVLELIEGPNYK